MKRLIIGISGASGAIYGVRLLQVLREVSDVETHLILSQAARQTLALETDFSLREVQALADVVHDARDIAASISSGSFKTAGISATITQLLGVSEPALFGIVMQSGLRAIMVMLTSSALGGMVLSLLSIKANSYGLAVLLSPLMYLYDRYQFVTYITVGLAVFIFAFIITFIFVKTDKATKEA